MPRITTVIFDLDGTLIDSSKSILEGFAAAFAESGRQPVVALEPGIIGPPLKETLAILAGTADPAVIDPLADSFKHYYDSEGYKATEVFPGVPEMLAALAACYPLYIATNKRIAPTRKILAHLGWLGHFREVYALDGFAPPARNKREMIARILSENRFAPTATLYVGDRDEDDQAAAGNGLPFAMACWGYGVPAKPFGSLTLSSLGSSHIACSGPDRLARAGTPLADFPATALRLSRHRQFFPVTPLGGSNCRSKESRHAANYQYQRPVAQLATKPEPDSGRSRHRAPASVLRPAHQQREGRRGRFSDFRANDLADPRP
jgi:phosphoglycolate phosphatase